MGSRLLAGHAAPSRIVWEHTRGRYSCMQCAFSTASRPAMTLHLEDHRPGAPAAPASGQPRPDPDARAGKARELAGGEGGVHEVRGGAEAQVPPPLPSWVPHLPSLDVVQWLLPLLSCSLRPYLTRLLYFNLKTYTSKSRAGGAIDHSSKSPRRRRGAGLPDLAPGKRRAFPGTLTHLCSG